MTNTEKLYVEKLEELRNKLYNRLPSGSVNAFDLIRIIQIHLKELDDLVANLKQQISEEEKTVSDEEIIELGESDKLPEKPLLFGWICPRCGVVHGPIEQQCYCPSPTRTWTDSNTYPEVNT